MYIRRHIFRLLAFTLSIAAASGVAWAAGKQPKKTDGDYNVTIAGYYQGKGNGSVATQKVMIHAKVSAGPGDKNLNLNASNLPLDGDHFKGTGNVNGTKVSINGRLDG